MSFQPDTLRKAKRLCEEVHQLIEDVEAQGARNSVDFAERCGHDPAHWVLWPSRLTGELRRRTLDLTRALSDLRRP